MFGNLTGVHLIIILVVIVLLFGAPKLPGLARSIGQSMRIFRSEVKTMKDENGDDTGSSSSSSTDSNDSTPPKP
jgi:sec-independent protein translocase protein TatA